jgi:hypothetical protein
MYRAKYHGEVLTKPGSATPAKLAKKQKSLILSL